MIYEPAEDSYLLSKVLKRYVKNKKVLDMGTGSGIQAETALKSKAKSVLAVDIDKEVIAFVSQKKIPSLHSDLFSKVTGKFEVILCNPPYLPLDSKEDKQSQRITTGGKQGDEFSLKFLKGAGTHLAPGGVILLLVSSLTPLSRIEQFLMAKGYRYKAVGTEKVFMEELKVLEITKIKKRV